MSWKKKCHSVAREIAALVTSEIPFILVDEGHLLGPEFPEGYP